MGRVVAVVGGGISGLAAARVLGGGSPVSAHGHAGAALEQGDGRLSASTDMEVVVLEAAERFGGKIASAEFRGRQVDFGPDNFLTRDPSAAELCHHLGIGDDLVAPVTSSASVLARGRLRPLPSGLVLGIPTELRALAHSGIVSGPGLVRAALDLVMPGARIGASNVGLCEAEAGNGSTSGSRLSEGAAGTPDREGPEWNAAAVLERRLGREVVEHLVDPLLGGINAGRTDQLSLGVVAPQVAQALAGERSVIRALRPLASDPPGTRARAGARPLFLGLHGGLSRMVDALVANLREEGVTLLTGTGVTSLRRTGGRYELDTPSRTVVADGVVLAMPAYEAARLLVDDVPVAAAELGSIPYSSVVLVTLAWRSSSISPLPAGSGFLVPRREGRMITGCTFMSAKWPHTAAPGEVVIRVSTGRYGDERPSAMPDEEVLEQVLDELRGLIDVSAPPLTSVVRRWPRAFPQYLPGHRRRVDRAQTALGELPGLAIGGAMVGGIGIAACVKSGERAALTVLDRLR